MFMIPLHSKFHINNNNGSLAICNKPKPKEEFCMAATSLFCILQNRTVTEAPYITSGLSALSAPTAVPTSHRSPHGLQTELICSKFAVPFSGRSVT